MSRYHSYLNTSVGIIGRYDGSVPLAVFLRSFFAAGKKYGAKDRKQISHLCYCYYRTGKMFKGNTLPDDDAIREYILAGLFLCSSQPNEMLQQLKPAWNTNVHLSIEEKCAIVHPAYNTPPLTAYHAPLTTPCSPLSVFPWRTALSEGIDHEAFCRSFFSQPDLFIRIRPGHNTAVQRKLDAADIPYRFVNAHGMAFPNTTKLDTVIELNKEAVIQDYSSQQVAEFLSSLQRDQQLSVWDCCAASGGKSILAKDILKNIKLTVSDIRKSILINLEKRFASAGIKPYTARVADLTNPLFTLHPSPFAAQQYGFDLIICDAPCSGSGTWARTPEQLYFWKEEDISHYTTIQKKILANIIPFIKPGGHLLYITCSVFKKENEAMVDEIKERFKLQLLKMEVLKGYDKKTDTLFAALLTLPK
ncbi:MAG TPA: Fmu (Sun) domain-containing protein [Agriterribacter sp.]|nr:Fmu (Sun) domain-containing protein [Agriterribacter sp.]